MPIRVCSLHDHVSTWQIWTAFVNDFELASRKSKFCKQSDLDTLFITIDTRAAKNQQERLKLEEESKRSGGGGSGPSPGVDKGGKPSPLTKQKTGLNLSTAKFEDKKQKFSRVEFMTAIVQISIKRWTNALAPLHVSDSSCYPLSTLAATPLLTTNLITTITTTTSAIITTTSIITTTTPLPRHPHS